MTAQVMEALEAAAAAEETPAEVHLPDQDALEDSDISIETVESVSVDYPSI